MLDIQQDQVGQFQKTVQLFHICCIVRMKGDTAGTGGKPATLSTGAVVKVPLFVQIGEVIKVDTRSGEYVSRVK